MAKTSSTAVSNADSVPRKLNTGILSHARLREAVATVETAAADAAGHQYRILRVHSSWRISSLEIGHDAVTGMTTADVGIWDTSANGDAVVDLDFFATNLDISAAGALTDRTYQRSAARISDIAKPLWEQLGLTSDPNKEYDVVVVATTNDPSVAVTISARLRYVDGS